MPRKQAPSQSDINIKLERMWREIPGAGTCPCKWGKLAEFIQRDAAEPERLEAADRIMQIALRQDFEFSGSQYRVASCTGKEIKCTDMDNEKGEVRVPVDYLLDSWAEIPPEERPPHPLLPFAKAYLDRPRRSPAKRVRKGYIPDIASNRVECPMTELDTPDLREIMLPGLQVRMLPDLETEEDERPALIALFDRLSEYHYLSGKKAFPSSVPIRLFVEALTILTLWERNGQIQSKHVRIKDIVEHWLQWNQDKYYPSGETTGMALRRAFGMLHNLAVSTPDGWYHPVMVRGISKGGDWGLKSELELWLRLPARKGDNKGVGAAIDMSMARYLGRHSLQAYRAYIHLVCDWDRTASRRSQVVNPVLPGVRRTTDSQILDKEGNPVYSEDGEPVIDRRHPRAVVDDELPVELNPYRNRWYSGYDADGILNLALPRHMAQDSRNRSKNLKQAMSAIEFVSESGGCIIEKLEPDGGLPWRVMPPANFNQLPKFFELQQILEPDGLQGRMI